MTELLQDRIGDMYDERPASVAVHHAVVRALIDQLTDYSPLEKSIIAWADGGRPDADFERLREAAWSFTETGTDAFRARLFAGFVTTCTDTDGFGADFLFDIANHLGIPAGITYEIMRSCHERLD